MVPLEVGAVLVSVCGSGVWQLGISGGLREKLKGISAYGGRWLRSSGLFFVCHAVI